MGMFMFGMISIYQLERMLDQGSPLLLVDLRTEEEYIYGHLYTAVNIPYESLADREEELYKGLPVLFYCEHGGKSMQAAREYAGREIGRASCRERV